MTRGCRTHATTTTKIAVAPGTELQSWI